MPGAQHLDWIPLKLKEVGTTEKAEKGSHFKYVKNKWWGRIYFKFQKLIFFFFLFCSLIGYPLQAIGLHLSQSQTPIIC